MALKSTFNVGGRVINAYRSYLETNIVQMLLCGCDWYRNFYGLKRKVKVSNFVLEFYVVKLICYKLWLKFICELIVLAHRISI